MRTKVLLLLAALTLAVAAPPAPAGAQGAPGGFGTVVIVHGLVDFPADVYLDGETTPALADFQYRRVTDPLALPAGIHRAELRRAGEPATAPASLSGTFTVQPDQRVTVAALLTPAGAPTWLAFPNDAPPADPGRVQLRFRHFAAAGAVDVVVDGRPVVTKVANASLGALPAPALLAPGRHEIGVTDANSGAALVPPQVVDVPAGAIANLYFVGRASSGSLGLLLQDPTVASGAVAAKALDVTPAAVHSGNTGLADPARSTTSTSGGLPAVVSIRLAGVAALLLVLSSVVGHRRIRPAQVRRPV